MSARGRLLQPQDDLSPPLVEAVVRDQEWHGLPFVHPTGAIDTLTEPLRLFTGFGGWGRRGPGGLAISAGQGRETGRGNAGKGDATAYCGQGGHETSCVAVVRGRGSGCAGEVGRAPTGDRPTGPVTQRTTSTSTPAPRRRSCSPRACSRSSRCASPLSVGRQPGARA